MQSKGDEGNKITEKMQFDQGWWEFILSDEPLMLNGEENGLDQKTENSRDNQNDWDYINELCLRDEIIQVTIMGFNKGGLLAKSEKIQGFIPVSHILDKYPPQELTEQSEFLKSRVGNTVNVKVIECNPELNKVVLSERAAQTENGKRIELISSLKTGTIVEGRVTNITKFGIFVDLGGIEGLVHISELSWGRVRCPSDYVKINQPISVLILSIDEKEMHVALSIKRLTPNPWFEIERKYKSGDIVSAKISKILPYGAFALLEEGVEGLIHISTIEMNDNIKDLNEIFRIEQSIMVEILHIDSKKHRLGLALIKPEK